MNKMKSQFGIAIVLNVIIATSVWTFAIPRAMAVDLHADQEGVYKSKVFCLPVRIADATLDITLLMDTFFRATLELKAGDNYIRFHLNDLSISGRFEYDIFELFAKVTSVDVALTLFIDTDGIIQGVPQVLITYYGLW